MPVYRVLGISFRVPEIEHQVPDVYSRVPDITIRVWSTNALVLSSLPAHIYTNMFLPSPSTRRNPCITMNRIPHIPCPSNPVPLDCMNPMSYNSSGKRNHTAWMVLELQLKAWHAHASIRIIPRSSENIEAFWHG